jgi:HPt (histidine-containing phosphotransfer) domain-containing protein
MIAARAPQGYVREFKQDAEADDLRAIDLVHLARQTDGDFALERELLSLFDVQSAKLIARLALADVGAQAKADIAHRLRGSALAIGARRVAAAAERLEAHYVEIVAIGASAGNPLPALQVAVAEARTEIARLNS